MNKIKQFLDFAAKEYYSGSPVITDAVFDKLAESIGYSSVGAKQHGNVNKHYARMYSLNKHYEDEGVRPLSDYKGHMVSTPKLDGAAISNLYLDGKLVMSLTRGDGIEGTDITDKMYSRKDLVPLEIPYLGILQATGEVVAPKEVPNSRNYSAGALNLKDLAEFNTRAISFFAYGFTGLYTDTYRSGINFLASFGFNTIFEPELHNIYPCDGIVVRIDNIKDFESYGYTADYPRGAYAVKERQEAVETKILAVEWGVGKSGKVTPVAILEPIMIGDAKVSRATLNNPEFIEALGLCIGDTVGVVRSGEIIPQIVYKVDA